jgi:hypothetical protein
VVPEGLLLNTFFISRADAAYPCEINIPVASPVIFPAHPELGSSPGHGWIVKNNLIFMISSFRND